MIKGSLFTRDFLLEGILGTSAWMSLDASVAALRPQIAAALTELANKRIPNEAETEEDLVYPVLELLGWTAKDVQPNASVKARDDVPDALLYADAAAKALAGPLPAWQRFQHGLCVVEAKRWKRALDREERARAGERGTPSSQMLRYLRRADDVTQGRLRWGILTNGCVWRLYYQGALSVAEDFLEIDLGKAFDLPGFALDLLDKRPDGFQDDDVWREHAIRLFALLFGRSAFLAAETGETFHSLALREGRRWESKVAKDLSDAVFTVAFPVLADALARFDPLRPATMSPAYLEEVKQGALILLYRLLFVLYAEDRDLLPDERGPYAPYCLTRIRREIAERLKSGGSFPGAIATIWPRLVAIFGAIGAGSDDLGIPPYNGGLFDPTGVPILGRAQIPDAPIALAISALSHTQDLDGRGPKYINYRDLSVQQLGAVYERILEFGLRATADGVVEPDIDDAARHKSGSYYTPEELVGLVIERAVGPLVTICIERFARLAAALIDDMRPVEHRLADLEAVDPANALLALKICDPAMGSGHFLVSLVDWLADKVLDAMAEASAGVVWGSYISPLAARITAVRNRILDEARLHRWPIVESQLDDRHVVRRMVLKRVVYGVDKNRMAVELAKVALWLHSFTVGAPLSFLDHHLRTGDSVVGAWVHPTVTFLRERGALFNLGGIAAVESVSGLMTEIEEMTDNDVVEVAASKAKFAAIENATKPLAALFSLLMSERMMGVFASTPRKPPDVRKLAGKSEKQIAKARIDAEAFERAAALQLVLEGTFGDPLRIADGRERIAPPELAAQLAFLPDEPPDQSSLFPAISIDDRRRLKADLLVEQARALSDVEDFCHWEIAFPNVWSNLLSSEHHGGFDAVIGNPPYVRQELLGESTKRALRAAYASFDSTADLFVYFYEQGLHLLRPGGRMSYVVTNKWLKAGYAANLREMFSAKGWLDFIADFGHAKHFFPDADVFPSVLAMRKPIGDIDSPTEADVCVIPRDAVPRKGLVALVKETTFTLPRTIFTREPWVLEPKPIMGLLDKISHSGMPLMDCAGIKPYRGILTGLNKAFLIDAQTRDALISADPRCDEIIKPYLRGQDIERWFSPQSGLFMILMKSSGNHDWPWSRDVSEDSAEETFSRQYPSLHKHLKNFEDLGIDKNTGKSIGLRHREDRGRFWWELRACDYYKEFDKRKIVYQAIQFSARYSLDSGNLYGNNKTFLLTTDSPAVLATLNSPVVWWMSWRRFLHLKDEALSNDAVKLVEMPMPVDLVRLQTMCEKPVSEVIGARAQICDADNVMQDWLRLEFGLANLGQMLSAPHLLNVENFITAVRRSLPRSRGLSAAEIARLKREHRETIEPACSAARKALGLERKLSEFVNAAYNLSPEDVALMWASAPPRMPITPPPNSPTLRRLPIAPRQSSES